MTNWGSVDACASLSMTSLGACPTLLCHCECLFLSFRAKRGIHTVRMPNRRVLKHLVTRFKNLGAQTFGSIAYVSYLDRLNTTPQTMAKPSAQQGEMEFLDHLEELRWRLIKGLIAVVVVAAVCAYFADFIVTEILIGPLKRASPNTKLQNLIPYGQISLYLQAIFFSAIIAAFPIFAYQIWKFVEPGLEPHEKSATRFLVTFVSLCFFAGVAFGYFVLLPVSLNFFAGFGTPLIENNISVDHYISFFVGTLLTCGLVFELPFISFVLSKIGLLTPPFMRHYRRHAIVGILILAAVITPSTDIITQLVLAVPMILLYEVSIWISALVQRQREKEEKAQAQPYLQP